MSPIRTTISRPTLKGGSEPANLHRHPGPYSPLCSTNRTRVHSSSIFRRISGDVLAST